MDDIFKPLKAYVVCSKPQNGKERLGSKPSISSLLFSVLLGWKQRVPGNLRTTVSSSTVLKWHRIAALHRGNMSSRVGDSGEGLRNDVDSEGRGGN